MWGESHVRPSYYDKLVLYIMIYEYNKNMKKHTRNLAPNFRTDSFGGFWFFFWLLHYSFSDCFIAAKTQPQKPFFPFVIWPRLYVYSLFLLLIELLLYYFLGIKRRYIIYITFTGMLHFGGWKRAQGWYDHISK